ncbi:hypothetical protein [Bradyrhizobium sp. SZCCHNR1020]|uniref:hypothetical protein n=1 Tax=Bradyrhizobium sp. SZCCHNR1020 TaxID=3057343 RepID=UPI002916BD8F|nr:hypothetical protein [Bradyrhizobium sp. SZCCHNR1020]
MTLFVVHDEAGQITQANKVFDPDGYGDLLADHGHSFVALPDVHHLPRPGHWHVHVGSQELRERPVMPVTIDKPTIRAGGHDTALISGIPREAKVGIYAIGQLLHEVGETDQVEIAIPVPCVYRVRITLWPYKDWEAEIEAI